MTLHGRLTLWSAGVVAAALVLFGAGAAWNLRDELAENLDDEITSEAHDFFAAIKQRAVDWHDGHSVEALFDQSKRFHYVEIHDLSGRPLYRSDNLEGTRLLPNEKGRGFRDLAWRDRNLRVGVFSESGITLALGKDLEETRETLAQLGTAYLLALPLVVIAVALGSWWIARRAVTPVRAIAAQAEKISASDLHQRIPPSGSQDELSDLARVLNEMFDRLNAASNKLLALPPTPLTN